MFQHLPAAVPVAMLDDPINPIHIQQNLMKAPFKSHYETPFISMKSQFISIISHPWKAALNHSHYFTMNIKIHENTPWNPWIHPLDPMKFPEKKQQKSHEVPTCWWFSTSIAVWVLRGIGGCRQETLHPQVKQHELSRIRFIVTI